VKDIAKKANSMSGADLENVINESAYFCIRANRKVIIDEDL
jgi:ATP-dependent Zn protease